MTFLEFKTKMFDLACFNVYQVCVATSFDGIILPVGRRKGTYPVTAKVFCFFRYKSKPIILFISPINLPPVIYQPAYSIIFLWDDTESVVQITSVTS